MNKQYRIFGVLSIIFMMAFCFSISLPLWAQEAEEGETQVSLEVEKAEPLEAEEGEAQVSLEVEKAELLEEEPMEEAAVGPEAEVVEGPPLSEVWKKYPPEVVVSKWGSEIRINVIPQSKMKKNDRLAIKSVKLETVDGEFLGLKTYSEAEVSREAEFTINPAMIDISEAKITVTSETEGDWVTIASLEQPVEPPPKVVSKPAVKKKAKPKKKGWFF